MLNQRNVDGELSRALDELLGAVKRVDQDETFRIDERARRASFFRDDRQVWNIALKAVTDNLVGLEVRRGHRRAVGLVPRARPVSREPA